jgi:phage/plasmid primase-like uncharacterized protein
MSVAARKARSDRQEIIMAKFKGVELATYVDPFPGMKNTDKVQVTCGNCDGTGEYQAPSGYSWVRNGRSTTWCFKCGGDGHVMRGVQSQRRLALQVAWWAEYGQAEEAAQVAESNARIAAAELAQAWDDAQAEQARRAQMVQGFLGQIGDKVTGQDGTVKVAKYMPSQQYGWSASMFIVIELDSGQVVKLSGSGESLFSVERGDKVTVTGTVKDQQVYNGQDQTVLTRAKLVRIEAREEVDA